MKGSSLKLFASFCIFLIAFGVSNSKTVKKDHEHLAAELEVLSAADAKQRKIACEPALFGRIPYDTSITGDVVFRDEMNACSVHSTPVPDKRLKGTPSIMMVHRSYDCSAVTQAKNAQRQGAKVLLVINSSNFGEDLVDWPLYDDGKGQNVGIPVLLIASKEGLELAEEISEGHDAYVQATFHSYHPNNEVNWEVWTTSSDAETYTTLRKFHKENTKLENYATMTPHYMTIQCRSWCEEEWKSKNCICGGKYCFEDAAAPYPINGVDIMHENIRQLCIFNETKKTEGKDPEPFWKYIEKFYSSCLEGKRFTKECSEDVMKSLGLDPTDIQHCVNQSYSDDGQENDLLALEAKRQRLFSISHYPYVLVNERPLYGELSTMNLLYTICSDLKNPELTDECVDIDKYAFVVDRRHNVSKIGIDMGIIFMILLFILAIFGFIFFLYRRHINQTMNKDVNLQVNTAVSQYFALAEDKK